MNHEIRTALDLILDGRDLSAEEMQAAMAVIMDGRASQAETAALLTALRIKGEAVAEIVGAARAMQERATKIPTTRKGLLDTCGTGGDGLHTFNISTATAFVAAAAGVPVAKHGNRSVSSSSGSADVLEALGVNIETPAGASRTMHRRTGNRFLFCSTAAFGHEARCTGAAGIGVPNDLQSIGTAHKSCES